MAQFIAFDSNVEINGYGLRSMFNGIAQTITETETTRLFQKYSLFPLDDNQWYLQQNCLDMLQELAGSIDLVAVGMRVFQPAANPDVKTVVDALSWLESAYQIVHRGGDCGAYQFSQLDEYLGRMICHNPYPADLDFGLFYSLLKHYQTTGDMCVEWDTKKPNRKKGADSCEFIIGW